VNVIDGIAAVANSAFFVDNARFVIFDDLNTWGWILILVGGAASVSGAAPRGRR
jgi:hypothetical protein